MNLVLVGSDDERAVFRMRKDQIKAGNEVPDSVAFVSGSVDPALVNLLHSSFLLYQVCTNTMFGLNFLVELATQQKNKPFLDYLQQLQDAILLAQRAAVVGPNTVNVEYAQERKRCPQ